MSSRYLGRKLSHSDEQNMYERCAICGSKQPETELHWNSGKERYECDICKKLIADSYTLCKN